MGSLSPKVGSVQEDNHPCMLPTVPQCCWRRGLQSAILGVQQQVPSVTELHIQGLLEQHGSVESNTLRIKYGLLGTVLRWGEECTLHCDLEG